MLLQTGKCKDGACTVRQSIDIDINTSSGAELHLVTDRSDGDKDYNGVDFDAVLIGSCPISEQCHGDLMLIRFQTMLMADTTCIRYAAY